MDGIGDGLVASTGSAVAQDVTYRGQIAALWQNKCIACHGAQSPERADFLLDEKGYAAKSQGPRMDSYERFIAFIAWPDTGALMRRSTTAAALMAAASRATCTSTSARRRASAHQLEVGQGLGRQRRWNLNRWEQRGDVPAVTKEQMEKIAVKY